MDRAHTFGASAAVLPLSRFIFVKLKQGYEQGERQAATRRQIRLSQRSPASTTLPQSISASLISHVTLRM